MAVPVITGNLESVARGIREIDPYTIAPVNGRKVRFTVPIKVSDKEFGVAISVFGKFLDLPPSHNCEARNVPLPSGLDRFIVTYWDLPLQYVGLPIAIKIPPSH